MTNQRSCVLATLAALVCSAGVEAQDTEWNRYTLEGLEGVFVRATVEASCDAFGLAPETLATAATEHLAEGPVTLLTEEEMLASPGLPELRIELSCASGDANGLAGAMAWALAVRVQQATQMIRDNQITLPESVTWYATDVGVTNETDAEERLRAALAETVGEFAAAFEAANADDEGEGGSI